EEPWERLQELWRHGVEGAQIFLDASARVTLNRAVKPSLPLYFLHLPAFTPLMNSGRLVLQSGPIPEDGRGAFWISARTAKSMMASYVWYPTMKPFQAFARVLLSSVGLISM